MEKCFIVTIIYLKEHVQLKSLSFGTRYCCIGYLSKVMWQDLMVTLTLAISRSFVNSLHKRFRWRSQTLWCHTRKYHCNWLTNLSSSHTMCSQVPSYIKLYYHTFTQWFHCIFLFAFHMSALQARLHAHSIIFSLLNCISTYLVLLLRTQD